MVTISVGNLGTRSSSACCKISPSTLSFITAAKRKSVLYSFEDDDGYTFAALSSLYHSVGSKMLSFFLLFTVPSTRESY